MNCHVGFYIPKSAASTHAGQVDLRIEGPVTHKGKPISNPVYSYRGGNKVYVFPSSVLKQNCSYASGESFILKEWIFNASSSIVESFATNFDSYISSYTYDSTKQCTCCVMNSSFVNMISGDVNGFAASAAFAKKLGNSVLWNYFSDPTHTSYLAYLPASLKDYGVAVIWWTPMTSEHVL